MVSRWSFRRLLLVASWSPGGCGGLGRSARASRGPAYMQGLRAGRTPSLRASLQHIVWFGLFSGFAVSPGIDVGEVGFSSADSTGRKDFNVSVVRFLGAVPAVVLNPKALEEPEKPGEPKP